MIGPGLDAARTAAFVRSGIGLGPPDQSMYGDEEIRDYARAEADYFRRHDIRVAVTGFTLTALLSTRLAGVRLVTEHAGSFVPPVLEQDPPPVPSRAAGGSRPASTAYTGGFERVAGELGVAGVPSLAALLLGDLTLVPEVPEVLGVPAEHVAAWRPAGHPGYRPETRLACTGPLFAHLDLPVPERVERFLAGGGTTVYVALTSTPADVVRGLVESLRALPVRILVAATVHDLDDLGSSQVLVERVLPSHRVMPQVDLAVTTGGQGSVQTAMATGTPLLAVPLHAEQELNVDARRAAGSRAGPRTDGDGDAGGRRDRGRDARGAAPPRPGRAGAALVRPRRRGGPRRASRAGRRGPLATAG